MAASPAPSTLPVSVILPSRNSMDKMPAHLEHHRALFLSCSEIVHCDSESSDGTKKYVATHLPHPALRQLDHPPGLYESWNYAIRRCSQSYIYISTVGDQIDSGGLESMLKLAERTSADVVFSPPRFVDEKGHSVQNLHWPVHDLIERYGPDYLSSPSPWVLFSEAVMHAPNGLLGSAASCLFRATFLKPRPFPLGFYGACDTAWGLKYLPQAHSVLLTDPVSTFLIHPKTYESNQQVNERIWILFKKYAEHLLSCYCRKGFDPAVEAHAPVSLLVNLREYNLATYLAALWYKRLIARRQAAHGWWFFSKAAWQARHRRHYYRRRVHSLRNRILEETTTLARIHPPLKREQPGSGNSLAQPSR